MEEKEINVTLNRSGNGNITPRLTLPLNWLSKIGVTEESKEVTAIYEPENKKIIISKELDDKNTFKGTGLFNFRGNNYRLNLTLKLETEGGYSLKGETEKGHSLSSYPLKDEEMYNPILTEITLRNNQGEIFSSQKFEDLFIRRAARENSSFIFIPRSRMFKFNSENDFEYHMIKLTNFDMKTNIALQTEEIVIRNLPFEKSLENELLIYNASKKNIDSEILNDIILSLELLQGKQLLKFSEIKIGKERILYSKSNSYKKSSNSILSNYSYSNEFIDRLLSFLKSLEEEEKKKWRRALRLLSNYQTLGNVEYLVRLFQFFNIFKSTSCERYKETLVEVFRLEEKEATFIRNIRNDIVHEGLFLDESISKNINDLNDSSSILKDYFDRAPENKNLLLGIYLQKIATEYVRDKIFIVNGDLVSKFGFSLFVDKDKVFKDFDSIFEQICNYRLKE